MINLNRLLALTLLSVLWQSTVSAEQEYTLEQAKSATSECKAEMDKLHEAGKRSDPKFRPYTQCVRACGGLVQEWEQSTRRYEIHCPARYKEATGESLPKISAVPTATPAKESAPATTPIYQVDAKTAAEFTTRKNDCAQYVSSEHKSVSKDALKCVSDCRVPINAISPQVVHAQQNRCTGRHGTFTRLYVPRIQPPTTTHFADITATLEYANSGAHLQKGEAGHVWKVVSSSDPTFTEQCSVIAYEYEIFNADNIQVNAVQETISKWKLARVAPSNIDHPVISSKHPVIGGDSLKCFVIDMEPLREINE